MRRALFLAVALSVAMIGKANAFYYSGNDLGRVLINREPNPDLDPPPNVRYWG
jgi:hypothetical protein